MAGISAPAKEFIRTSLVRQGIPSSLADEMVAKAPAGTNLSLGASSHDNAALDIMDVLSVAVGFPSQGRITEAFQLEQARNSAANSPGHYPPAQSHANTNYLKNA